MMRTPALPRTIGLTIAAIAKMAEPLLRKLSPSVIVFIITFVAIGVFRVFRFSLIQTLLVLAPVSVAIVALVVVSSRTLIGYRVAGIWWPLSQQLQFGGRRVATFFTRVRDCLCAAQLRIAISGWSDSSIPRPSRSQRVDSGAID